MDKLTIEDIVAKMEGLKYARRTIAQVNSGSQAAMEAENLAVDECIAIVREALSNKDSDNG